MSCQDPPKSHRLAVSCAFAPCWHYNTVYRVGDETEKWTFAESLKLRRPVDKRMNHEWLSRALMCGLIAVWGWKWTCWWAMAQICNSPPPPPNQWLEAVRGPACKPIPRHVCFFSAYFCLLPVSPAFPLTHWMKSWLRDEKNARYLLIQLLCVVVPSKSISLILQAKYAAGNQSQVCKI